MSHNSFTRIPGFTRKSFTVESLRQLTHILQRHDVREIKFTTGHRLTVPSQMPDLQQLVNDLLPLSVPDENSWITTLQTCPGRDSCKYGMRDGEALARRIEAIQLPQPLCTKVKIGIAGCRMCCTEPFVRDIGLIAEQTGWKLIFGGNAGSRPRIGDTIAVSLSDDEAVELICRCLRVYQEQVGLKKMRTARFIESFGLENFLKAVL